MDSCFSVLFRYQDEFNYNALKLCVDKNITLEVKKMNEIEEVKS